MILGRVSILNVLILTKLIESVLDKGLQRASWLVLSEVSRATTPNTVLKETGGVVVLREKKK